MREAKASLTEAKASMNEAKASLNDFKVKTNRRKFQKISFSLVALLMQIIGFNIL